MSFSVLVARRAVRRQKVAEGFVWLPAVPSAKRAEHLIGMPRQCARDTTNRRKCIGGDEPRLFVANFPQLGERKLEQRQSPVGM